MQKKHWALLAGALVIVAIVVYVVALRPSSSTASGPGAPGGFRGGPQGPTVVMAAPVQKGEFAVEASFVGTLRGVSTAELFAKTTGPITRLYVDTGDRVRAGQVLAQIDDAEEREDVRQAEAALKIAQATLSQRDAALKVAQQNAERARQLFQRKVASEQEYQDAEATLLSAQAQYELSEAQIDQAQANLSKAQLQLDNTRIVAPFSGFIGKRLLDLGAFATTSRAVFTLVDLSTIKTSVALVDKDLPKVAAGQEAKVVSDALGGRVFQGKIARVSPVLDPQTGTAEAEIEIANADGALRPGMLVRVNIAYRTEPSALLVPREALVESEQGTFLYVAEAREDQSMTARQVSVRLLGSRQDAAQTMVAVEGAIDVDDQVVTLGQESLRDGAPIRLAGAAQAREVARQETPSL